MPSTKSEVLDMEGSNTMVWTIPTRCDLNVDTVLARSKADMSPMRIRWIVLWIAQYVPVLPIPALSQREIVSGMYMIELNILELYFKVIQICWTCNAPLLGQDLVALVVLFSRFHELQVCWWELHGQAIQDIECAKLILVGPLTAKW